MRGAAGGARPGQQGFGGPAVAGYTPLASAQQQGYKGAGPSQMAMDRYGGGGAGGRGGATEHQRPRNNNPNYERPTVDCNTSLIRTLQSRAYQTNQQDYAALQPNLEYMRDMLLPAGMLDNPSNSYCTHHCHTAVNREKFPIYCATWTPEGRRVITGAQSGEFTLWNGLHFNFETIVTGHENANRCMTWSHDEQTMVTGDDLGAIKYWNPEMAMVHRIDNISDSDAHSQPLRDLSISPMDLKFASCGDDHFVKVWDYNTQKCERTYNQGNDVKSVAWHPTKGLLVCGDKNNVITLLDPRVAEKKLRTIYDHKGEVSVVRWNRNGNWFLSGSRDQHLKLWDLRALDEPIRDYACENKGVTSIAWHPVHEDMWVSGGMDGSMSYWVSQHEHAQASFKAHEAAVWALDWHPCGHLLVSGSQDKSARFWCRNRLEDKVGGRLLRPFARQFWLCMFGTCVWACVFLSRKIEEETGRGRWTTVTTIQRWLPRRERREVHSGSSSRWVWWPRRRPRRRPAPARRRSPRTAAAAAAAAAVSQAAA
jgi:WD40 repeat protein